MKLTIWCHTYHWMGFFSDGAYELKDEIPRYGNGDFCRYDPWDYIARRLLERAKCDGKDVVAMMGKVEERWNALRRAEAIEKELSQCNGGAS